MGSIPGLGRSLRGRYSNPLQYSCLENSMDRRAWRATVHGIPKSKTPLSAHTLLRVPFRGPMVGFYPSIRVEQSKQRKEEVARTGSLTTASGESSHGPQPEWVQPLTRCHQKEEMENAEQFAPISLHHMLNLDKCTGWDGDHRDQLGWADTHSHILLPLPLTTSVCVLP